MAKLTNKLLFGRLIAVLISLLAFAYLLFHWVEYFRDVDRYNRSEFLGFVTFVGGYWLVLMILVFNGWLIYRFFYFFSTTTLSEHIYRLTLHLCLFLVFYLIVRELLSNDPQFVPENMLLASLGLGVVIISQKMFESSRQKQQVLLWEKERKQAELKMIKAQINPHFLFNALNMLYSDALKIEASEITNNLEKLTEILRYHLYSSPDRPMRLEDEVNLIRQYVAFQKQRLKFSEDIEIELFEEINSPELPVYPFILISLIENAFKHGISHEKASFVSITIKENFGKLTMTTCNTNYPKNWKESSGIGTQQLNELLVRYYPGYEFDQYVSDNHYHVKLTIDLNESV